MSETTVLTVEQVKNHTANLESLALIKGFQDDRLSVLALRDSHETLRAEADDWECIAESQAAQIKDLRAEVERLTQEKDAIPQHVDAYLDSRILELEAALAAMTAERDRLYISVRKLEAYMNPQDVMDAMNAPEPCDD